MDNLDHVTPAEDHNAIRQLARQCDCDIAIEVGSWAGYTTNLLTERFEWVYAVDHWQGSERLSAIADRVGHDEVFRTFCRNVGNRLMRNVIPLKGSSLLWASAWPDTWQADFIFIDAAHDYESVKADIAAWWPHLEPGGIMCGHDYHSHPGVKQAADEFGIDGTIANVWWRRK